MLNTKLRLLPLFFAAVTPQVFPALIRGYRELSGNESGTNLLPEGYEQKEAVPNEGTGTATENSGIVTGETDTAAPTEKTISPDITAPPEATEPAEVATTQTGTETAGTTETEVTPMPAAPSPSPTSPPSPFPATPGNSTQQPVQETRRPTPGGENVPMATVTPQKETVNLQDYGVDIDATEDAVNFTWNPPTQQADTGAVTWETVEETLVRYWHQLHDYIQKKIEELRKKGKQSADDTNKKLEERFGEAIRKVKKLLSAEYKFGKALFNNDFAVSGLSSKVANITLPPRILKNKESIFKLPDGTIYVTSPLISSFSRLSAFLMSISMMRSPMERGNFSYIQLPTAHTMMTLMKVWMECYSEIVGYMVFSPEGRKTAMTYVGKAIAAYKKDLEKLLGVVPPTLIKKGGVDTETAKAKAETMQTIFYRLAKHSMEKEIGRMEAIKNVSEWDKIIRLLPEKMGDRRDLVGSKAAYHYRMTPKDYAITSFRSLFFNTAYITGVTKFIRSIYNMLAIDVLGGMNPQFSAQARNRFREALGKTISLIGGGLSFAPSVFFNAGTKFMNGITGRIEAMRLNADLISHELRRKYYKREGYTGFVPFDRCGDPEFQKLSKEMFTGVTLKGVKGGSTETGGGIVGNEGDLGGGGTTDAGTTDFGADETSGTTDATNSERAGYNFTAEDEL